MATVEVQLPNDVPVTTGQGCPTEFLSDTGAFPVQSFFFL